MYYNIFIPTLLDKNDMLQAWTKKRFRKSNSPTAVLELGFAIIASVIFFKIGEKKFNK